MRYNLCESMDISGGKSEHRGWVRLTHWIVTAAFLTLAFTGVMILMVHPRLYWGEAGNDLMQPLVEPIGMRLFVFYVLHFRH